MVLSEHKMVSQNKRYDAIIIYAHQDRDKAVTILTGLKDIIGNDVGFQVALFDDSQFSSLEEALQASSIAFLLLTEYFCENDWPALCNNRMFAETLYTQKPCTITPVVLPSKVEEQVKIPMGLKCIKQFRFDFEDELVKKSVTRIFNVKVRE